jgi:hypothetical protein
MADGYDAGGRRVRLRDANPKNPDIIFAGSYGGLLTPRTCAPASSAT